MAKHTPTPWKLEVPTEFSSSETSKTLISIYATNGKHICDKMIVTRLQDAATADMHRIIDCVNAMAGIEEPAKYVAGVKLLEKLYHEQQQEISHLRASLREMIEHTEVTEGRWHIPDQLIDKAKQHL